MNKVKKLTVIMTAAFTFAIAACNENSEISPENAEPVKDNRLAMNTALKELTDDAVYLTSCVEQDTDEDYDTYYNEIETQTAC